MRVLKDARIRRGMRVLVRADLDVPVKSGRVVDDFRLRAGAPTIKYLLRRGARVRILGYLGRPKGRVIKKFSLRPVAARLERLLGLKVVFIRDPLNPAAFKKFNDSSDILLFENTRFFPGEEKNSIEFARRLSRWGDLYVNEAFANSHRRYASVETLARILPSYAGLRLEKEIFNLSKIFDQPKRPIVALIGGLKTETKIPVIERFLLLGATVLLAGVPANTFSLAKGEYIGRSVADEGFVPRVRRLLGNLRIILPVDVKWKDGAIIDVGPLTVNKFLEKAGTAKVFVWNGPLGNTPKFFRGTIDFAKGLKRKRDQLRIVGGGDTVTILEGHRAVGAFDHVSTGGGAMLEFLAGKRLPGIEVLKK